MLLRKYQVDMIDQVRSKMMVGVRSILLTSPTGSGKTATVAHMLKTSSTKGFNSWFICHRREICNQAVKAFTDIGCKVGIVSAGFEPDYKQPIQVCSIQTLVKRYHKLELPKLVIWDEAHHQAAGTWSAMFQKLAGAYHIGLTATPERLDGSGLDRFYQHMIHGPSVRWLIDNGFLCDFRVFAPPTVSTAGLHTRMGDYIKEEVTALVDKPTITGNAIEHYRKHAYGKRAIVFAAGIEHSKHVAEQFNAVGIPAEHVDGDTKPEVRDNAIRRFEQGRILVLSNVDLFGEGFDCPSAEIAVFLRPTKSTSLYLQTCGRVLRTYSGKSEAIILDHVGNVSRHGFPDDERIWTLAGRESNRRTVEAGKSVRTCSRCFAAQWSGKPVCGFCGFIFEIESREVRTVEGELSEFDRASIAVRRRDEQRRAQSLNELIAIGKERGYKPGWAWFVYKARQGGRVTVPAGVPHLVSDEELEISVRKMARDRERRERMV